MAIYIDGKEYSYNTFEDLKNLVQQFPESRDTIFDQLYSHPIYSKMSVVWFTQPFTISFMLKLFPEKEQIYFHNVMLALEEYIGKYYLANKEKIPRKDYIDFFESYSNLFPNRKYELINFFLKYLSPASKILNDIKNLSEIFDWNELLVNILSNPEKIQDYFEMYLLVKIFPDHEKNIFDSVFGKPYLVEKVKNLLELKELVNALPQFKEELFNIFIGNPSHLKRLLYTDDQSETADGNFKLVQELFPEHYEIQNKALYEALPILERQWEDKQIKERNSIRSAYKIINLLTRRGHPLFCNLPTDVAFTIVSFASDPMIHDSHEQASMNAQFMNKK